MVKVTKASFAQPVAFCVEGFACWQSGELYVVAVHPGPPGLQAANMLTGVGIRGFVGFRARAGAKFRQRPVSYTMYMVGTLPLGMGQDVTLGGVYTSLTSAAEVGRV